MTTIAVVYQSGFGHTEKQAQAVAEGAAAVAGARAILLPVAEAEARIEELNAADAIVFGTPTYMGGVSGPFKTFMDATSKVWYGRGWKDKVASGFTNSASQSGDKLNSLISLAIFAAQPGMIWLGLDPLPGHNNSKGSVNTLTRLRGFLVDQAQADRTP